ncbi:MAG: hypothetical protein V7K90_29195 [Nostoc sp.]
MTYTYLADSTYFLVVRLTGNNRSDRFGLSMHYFVTKSVTAILFDLALV